MHWKRVSLGIIRPAGASLHHEPVRSRAPLGRGAFDEMLRSTVTNTSDHDIFQVVSGRFKGIEKDEACNWVVEAKQRNSQRDG